MAYNQLSGHANQEPYSPHYYFLDLAPPQSKTTIKSSLFVPFYLTLFLIHKLTDTQLPHHVALDNGITSPR